MAGALANAIRPLAASGLERLDLESQPFAEGSGDKAANAVRLPARCAHQVRQRSAARAFQQGQNLGLLGAFSASVGLLFARRLPGGLAAPGSDLAAWFARGEALDSVPDTTNSQAAVREPLDWNQARNSVPDIHQAAAGPGGSELSKFLFAGELLAPLVGDFGFRGVSSDVAFRVDGEDRH